MSKRAPARAEGSNPWGHRRWSLRDLVAGLSVAMLLIPQSMAYAELAGLPSSQGLFASTLPLIASGLLASCPYLQTGPVALTALLTHGALVVVLEPGSEAYSGAGALLALIVGGARLAISMAKFGKITYLLAQPVLRGFTSGAVILILLSQLPGVAGRSGYSEEGLLRSATLLLAELPTWNIAAVLLAAATVLLIQAGRRIHVSFPGALAAVALGSAVALWGGYGGPTVGEISTAGFRFSLSLPWALFPQLVLPGVLIALVGFAESTAVARSLASQDGAKWRPNREFLSQGAANVASGLFGGMCVDGSFSRTGLGRVTGAESRWAVLFTGVVVLLFLPVAGVLSHLPKAVMAGIVIVAVVPLVRPRVLVDVWRISPPQASVVWLTLIFCLLLSPRIEQALLLGILASLAVHVWQQRQTGVEGWREGSVLRLEPRGILWFASAPLMEGALLERARGERDVSEVVVHLEGLGRIDLTGALALKRVASELREAGIPTRIVGIPPQSREVLRKVFGTPGLYL